MTIPPRPKTDINHVTAISEVFQILSLDVPNEAVAAYVREHHGFDVSAEQVELVRKAIAAEQ